MTCVIGMIGKHKLYMGCESQLSTESSKLFLSKENSKVFKNGEFIFGCCGYPRMISLLRYSLAIPKQLTTQTDIEYMNTEFIESIRTLFTDKGFIGKFSDGIQRGATFLVGYHGKLYRVDNDFQVLLLKDNIAGVGSGAEYALPALSALENTKIKTLEKINIAIDCAKKYDLYSGGDIHIEEMEI